MCALSPHTHKLIIKPSRDWHHHEEMDCHNFMLNCQFLPLSVFSGIKEEDVVYKQGVPILPTVSTHHMAPACADLWGLRLVPHLTAPHESNNVSLKSKLLSAWLCAQVCPSVCMPKRQSKNYYESTGCNNIKSYSDSAYCNLCILTYTFCLRQKGFHYFSYALSLTFLHIYLFFQLVFQNSWVQN